MHHKRVGKKPVVVLGAGLAGLSAAWRLSEVGVPVVVLEKESQISGLCATTKVGDFLFDYGGHRFITKDKEVLSKIEGLLGKEFNPHYRKTQYFLWERFINYPLTFKDFIFKVNPILSGACFLDYFVTGLRNCVFPFSENNFRDWIVKRFGTRLYKIFFGDYTEKVWGSAEKLNSEWASQRISIPSLWGVLKEMLFKSKDTPRTYEQKYYYPDFGIGRIGERMAEKILGNGGKILTNCAVTGLKRDNNRVTSVSFIGSGGKLNIECKTVLSTIPLSAVVKMFSPLPPKNILESTDQLRSRGIIFVFLNINQERISDNDALYIPEKKYFFFRLEQYKFWSKFMAPKDKTGICLEIGCFERDKIWNLSDEEIIERSLQSLADTKLFRDRGLVEHAMVVRKGEVYPFFDLDYKPHVKKVRDWVDSLENFVAFGRQGYFQYVHMHHVIKMGFRAADYVLGSLGSTGSINKIEDHGEYFG